jgi:zinc transport system substrate-binding protein
MKHTLMILLTILSTLFLSACQPQEAKDKPLIMTTIFPYYDIAKQLVGDAADVEMILPLGSDSHHFEPTPRQITSIKKADLIIFTGLELEPWMGSLIKNTSLKVLDLSQSIELMDAINDDDDDHDHHHDHDHHDDDESWIQKWWNTMLGWLGISNQEDDLHLKDPHFWLDPVLAKQMVIEIASSLKELLPESSFSIETNQNLLLLSLDELHADYLDLIQNSTTQHIMHAGHNAFSYFAKRYQISYHTPYEGFSSDAEPKPQALTHMMQLMKDHNIKYLYAEIELKPMVANAIVEQTQATILYLYNAETISEANYNLGLTFIDMLRHNFEQIKRGLLNE